MAANTWGSLSGTTSVPHLTEYLRQQAQEQQGFDQLTVPPSHGYSLGKNKGDTVQYTYFQNITSTGGELSETERVKTGSVPFIKTNYTIKEYGNGFTYSERLEIFEQLDVEDAFMAALVDEMKKLKNRLAFAEFDSTAWKVAFGATPASNEFKQGASLTVTAAADLSRDNLRFVVKKAKLNNIPKFDGESYAYITGVESSEALRYDTNVQTSLREDSGLSALNGEVTRLVECRILEDSHVISKIGATQYDVGYLIGADCVLNDWALPPEIRAQDDDFGRACEVAYIFYAAWKKILSHSVHGMEHCIKVTSA